MPLGGPITATLWAPAARVRGREEDGLQATVMAFLDRALPPHAIAQHAPGEGKRSRWAQAALKRSGYKPGWPDIEIVWRGMPNVYVELKTPRGALSRVQRDMHKRLQFCGCTVLLCRSPECVEESLRELGMPLRATLGGRR